MLGEGFARRAAAVVGWRVGCSRDGLIGHDLVLGRGSLKFFQLQLKLVDQPGAAFGTRAILLALQLGDLQLQRRDQRLRAGHDSPHLHQFGLGGRQFSVQSLEFGMGI